LVLHLLKEGEKNGNGRVGFKFDKDIDFCTFLRQNILKELIQIATLNFFEIYCW